MNKERLKIQYNVDADKVPFTPVVVNGRELYAVSNCADTADRHYIIKEDDNYTVVLSTTNSVSKWRCDLSSLETE